MRFLSCEPLLGKLHLKNVLSEDQINWVIAGGESGAKARPSDPDWIRAIRDQCINNEIPFHFKQWGEWAPINHLSKTIPKTILKQGDYSECMGRYGKQTAGRILDDRTWDDIPNTGSKNYPTHIRPNTKSSRVAPREGFEPSTCPLGGGRAIQLCHRGIS